jgi:phage shock protein PspC (stress-responsive transcriptional regulator)
MNTATVNPEADTHTDSYSDTFSAADGTRSQTLTRPVEDRMLAGVAAGIGNFLGVDATIVRIVLAVLTVVGGAGVPIYAAGWLLIPEEGQDKSIAASFIDSRRNRAL